MVPIEEPYRIDWKAVGDDNYLVIEGNNAQVGNGAESGKTMVLSGTLGEMKGLVKTWVGDTNYLTDEKTIKIK